MTNSSLPVFDDRPRASAYRRPSADQLDFLRKLSNKTGVPFETPATAAQASRQIDALKSLPPASHLERDVARRELRDIRNELAAGYGTAEPEPLPRDIDREPRQPHRRDLASRRGITAWTETSR
jgi:hypothetical protein